MENITIEKSNGYSTGVIKTDGGISIPSPNEVLGGDSRFFASYASGETALVIPGEDGIGVFFAVLDGDHRDAFKEIITTKHNPLGECLRYITHHRDIIKAGSGLFAFPDSLKLTK